ncbi:MAG: NTP transferase domain-containing protein [Polyangiaceae bacterium]
MPPSPPSLSAFQAVVLAGGLATRMLPRTERVPKLLLEVAGRPFAERLLARLAASGATEVILCIGHLGDLIREALGDGTRFGLSLFYSDEGDARLGTAGALRLALPHLAPVFLVTYGDSFLPFDYASPVRDLSAHPEALGTMAVYRNSDRHDTSNTEVSENLVVRYEKRAAGAPHDPRMDHIDYGATALRREVVSPLPEHTPLDLSDLQSRLSREGKLRALTAPHRFYEIGSESGLRDLDRHLREGRVPLVDGDPLPPARAPAPGGDPE